MEGASVCGKVAVGYAPSIPTAGSSGTAGSSTAGGAPTMRGRSPGGTSAQGIGDGSDRSFPTSAYYRASRRTMQLSLLSLGKRCCTGALSLQRRN